MLEFFSHRHYFSAIWFNHHLSCVFIFISSRSKVFPLICLEMWFSEGICLFGCSYHETVSYNLIRIWRNYNSNNKLVKANERYLCPSKSKRDLSKKSLVLWTIMTAVANFSNVTQISSNNGTIPHTFIFDIARSCYCGWKTSILCHIFSDNSINRRELNFGLPDGSKYVLVVLYAIIIAVSLFGNVLVVLTFAFNKHMRSTTNLFILSLAVSDILLTITTTPFNLGSVLVTSWIFGSFACKLVPAMMTFCVACSSLTLCCIAFDRFYAIVYPLRMKFFQATTRTVPLLVLVWVISLVAAVPQAVYYKLVEFKSICGKVTEVCLSPVLDTDTLGSLYQWLPFCLLFGLPLTIMMGLYGIIIRKLWKKAPDWSRCKGGRFIQNNAEEKSYQNVGYCSCCFCCLLVSASVFPCHQCRVDVPISRRSAAFEDVFALFRFK